MTGTHALGGPSTRWWLLMSLLAVSLRVSGAATPVQFGPFTNYPAGQFPGALAVGDFNKDTIPDVVAIAGGLSVLLGNGIGGLHAPTNSAFGVFGPGAVATGDFNRDGNLDLLEADWYSTRIFLGDGAGNFSLRTNMFGDNNFSTYPAAVAVGDLNGDVIPDIVVANTGNPSGRGIAVGFGRGDGLFGAPIAYGLPQTPADIALGDINGDGSLDAAVSLRFNFGGVSRSVTVLTNRGDGTLVTAQHYDAAISDTHPSVKLADLRGFGVLDLVLLNNGARSVTIRFNDGTGMFGSPTNYPLDFQTIGMVVADFNGDDNLDLAIRGAGQARALMGNGDGSFAVGTMIPVPCDGMGPGSIAAGDFDTNGTPDLVYVCANNSFVGIRLNRTAPSLRITPTPTGNSITWSAGFGAGFSLWSAPDLGGGWEPFAGQPQLIGNRKIVTDSTAGGSRFYRLMKAP